MSQADPAAIRRTVPSAASGATPDAASDAGAAPVRHEVVDGVATITLDRPEAMNSLDLATKVALRDAVLAAAEDDAVRCVVLTGTGRAFCVGQDLKEHVGLLREGSDSPLSTVEEHYNPTVTALATMHKPVVAAVNGVAAGAGASLALACDFRIVADTAGFNLAFAGIGLSCDTGISWTLPRIVGHARATELLYFPRTVPAAEALELGLATQVVAPDRLAGAVAELAGRLAAGPTRAYGAIRRSLGTAAGASITEAVAFESSMMALTGATRDHRAAVDAFLAKERPVFEGR
jgi:2-(1,2-epoxy-1,2-dihydrophenyl)acetyl-CoA isomerase